MTDEQRLKEIRAGREEPFLELYREHQGGIFRFALRMCGDAALAEDVVQEVFLNLIRPFNGEAGYDPRRGSLTSYLYGMARNLVRGRLRARGRLHSLGDEESETLFNGVWREWESAVATPQDDLVRRETIEAVRQSVLALPEHYREAIILCDLHEMSYQEVASILDCSLGTVRSRLHRGRLLLLDRLRGEMQAGRLEEDEERTVNKVI
ncbi:MAG: RNA polymerase sigma factor [Acidobacteriota bacterium]